MEGHTAILIELLCPSVVCAFSPEPDPPAFLPAASVLLDLAVPVSACRIVARQMRSWYLKEKVIIHPLCDGAHPMSSEDFCPGVSQHSILLCPDRDTRLDVSTRYLWFQWISGTRVQWFRRGLDDQVETEDERDQRSSVETMNCQIKTKTKLRSTTDTKAILIVGGSTAYSK